MIDQLKRLMKEGLIGCYDGIGYGNMSWISRGTFRITCTGVGCVKSPRAAHITKDEGASSDIGLHKALYEKIPYLKAIVHIHSRPIWLRLPLAYGGLHSKTLPKEIARMFPDGRKTFAVAIFEHENGVFLGGRDIVQVTDFAVAMHHTFS